MQITRRSIITGIERTLDIQIAEDDYEKWNNGALIQNAAPYLSESDREFIMTGITTEEWELYLEPDDDE